MEKLNLAAMEELSDFYMMDLYDMLDHNGEFHVPSKPLHGLKHDEVEPQDYHSIVQFGRIVKNYQRLKKLEKSNF